MVVRSFVFGIVMLAILGASGTAIADGTSSAEPAVGTPVLRIVNGRRMYVMPPVHIPGQPQQPYNFALTDRRRPEYAPTEPPAPQTVVEVVRAVQRSPF